MLKNVKIYDLTHTIDTNIPTWDGKCGYHPKKVADYSDGGFRVFEYNLVAGCGTHMDAPSHKIPGGATIDKINVHNFVAPLCIVDVSHKTSKDYVVSVDDIKECEKKQGISAGSFVIINTGWHKYWNTPAHYSGVDDKGVRHFPAISTDAADCLRDLNISGVGVDTLGPETGENGFPVHDILLGAGKIIVENLTIPAEVPDTGATVIILPLKLKGGSESPVRAIALVEDQKDCLALSLRSSE